VSSITPHRTNPGTSLAVQISTSIQASAVPSSSEVSYTNTTVTNISFNPARTTGLASRSAEAVSSSAPACGSPLFVTTTETDTITITEVASGGFGAGAKVTEEPLCGQTIYSYCGLMRFRHISEWIRISLYTFVLTLVFSLGNVRLQSGGLRFSSE